MKSIYLLLIPGLIFLGSGCVLEDHHHHCYGSDCVSNPSNGDISFDWGFLYTDGLTHYCDEPIIDVRTVHVAIHDITGGIYSLEYSNDFPCSYGGVTVYDFIPGDYEIYLEGVSSADAYDYTGYFDGPVYAGQTNEFGLLVLH